MENLKKLAAGFVRDESGQSMIEYTLVATLIGVAAIATMTPLGTAISAAFSKITSSLTAA